MKHKIRFYTGPAFVEQVGDKMLEINDNDISDVIIGTEHVYCTVEGNDCAGAAWNLGVAWFNAFRFIDDFPEFPFYRNVECVHHYAPRVPVWAFDAQGIA